MTAEEYLARWPTSAEMPEVVGEPDMLFFPVNQTAIATPKFYRRYIRHLAENEILGRCGDAIAYRLI